MKSFTRAGFAASFVLIIAAGTGWQSPQEESESIQSETQSIEDQFEAIDNMHHFMEYVSQPGYLALKEALAEEPEGRNAWRSIKSHALILAETSVIVCRRVPEDADAEQAAEWQKISLEVYKSGKALYGSIGNYDEARGHYETMIDNCNRCHQVFDNGKHQLEK